MKLRLLAATGEAASYVVPNVMTRAVETAYVRSQMTPVNRV